MWRKYVVNAACYPIRKSIDHLKNRQIYRKNFRRFKEAVSEVYEIIPIKWSDLSKEMFGCRDWHFICEK